MWSGLTSSRSTCYLGPFHETRQSHFGETRAEDSASQMFTSLRVWFTSLSRACPGPGSRLVPSQLCVFGVDCNVRSWCCSRFDEGPVPPAVAVLQGRGVSPGRPSLPGPSSCSSSSCRDPLRHSVLPPSGNHSLQPDTLRWVPSGPENRAQTDPSV